MPHALSRGFTPKTTGLFIGKDFLENLGRSFGCGGVGMDTAHFEPKSRGIANEAGAVIVMGKTQEGLARVHPISFRLAGHLGTAASPDDHGTESREVADRVEVAAT